MKYADMFSICKNPNKYAHSDGLIYEHRVEYNNPFDLPDPNKYDVTRSKIVEQAKDIEYYFNFLIRLGKVHNADIPKFLNYHFNFTPDKELYFAVVRTRIGEDFKLENPKKNAIIEEWLDENKAMWKMKNSVTPSVSKPTKAEKQCTTTYKHWALYFYYCQRKGIFPNFEDLPNIKIKTFLDFCREHNLKSVKRFQMDYNEISKPKNRLHPFNLKSIGYVLTLLQDVPEAYKLANDEYKTVKAKC